MGSDKNKGGSMKQKHLLATDEDIFTNSEFDRLAPFLDVAHVIEKGPLPLHGSYMANWQDSKGNDWFFHYSIRDGWTLAQMGAGGAKYSGEGKPNRASIRDAVYRINEHVKKGTMKRKYLLAPGTVPVEDKDLMPKTKKERERGKFVPKIEDYGMQAKVRGLDAQNRTAEELYDIVRYFQDTNKPCKVIKGM